jgi:hypothetical protein
MRSSRRRLLKVKHIFEWFPLIFRLSGNYVYLHTCQLRFVQI